MTNCVKYHPAPEVCRCEPFLINGEPAVLSVGGKQYDGK